MKLKIKKMVPEATIPKYATTGSSGLDLVATTEKIDLDNGYIAYGTGLAFEIPEGFEGQVRPRSSIRTKDLMLINAPGTVDSDYRGEVFVTFKPTRPMKARKYSVGDKIAQIVICPIVQAQLVEVEDLSNTDRGSGGHGSSDGR